MSNHQRIHLDDAPAPSAPLSPAVAWDKLVFVSGQVPRTSAGDVTTGGIRPQTATVLDNLERVLHAASSSLPHVVKVVVYLTDIVDMAAMNEVYRDRFGAELPARTTIAAAALGNPDYLVEIEAIAIKE